MVDAQYEGIQQFSVNTKIGHLEFWVLKSVGIQKLMGTQKFG